MQANTSTSARSRNAGSLGNLGHQVAGDPASLLVSVALAATLNKALVAFSPVRDGLRYRRATPSRGTLPISAAS